MACFWDVPPGLTQEEDDAIKAYARRIALAAPPPTVELIARLRPILALSPEQDEIDAA